MIYSIALLLAVVIIAIGAVMTRQVDREVGDRFEQFKQKLKSDKAAGTLPPELADVDIDNLRFGDIPMGMPMSDSLKPRADLSVCIKDFWFVLVPLVLALCLGVAFFADYLLRTNVRRPDL